MKKIRDIGYFAENSAVLTPNGPIGGPALTKVDGCFSERCLFHQRGDACQRTVRLAGRRGSTPHAESRLHLRSDTSRLIDRFFSNGFAFPVWDGALEPGHDGGISCRQDLTVTRRTGFAGLTFPAMSRPSFGAHRGRCPIVDVHWFASFCLPTLLNLTSATKAGEVPRARGTAAVLEVES